jgi:hypothetical protein
MFQDNTSIFQYGVKELATSAWGKKKWVVNPIFDIERTRWSVVVVCCWKSRRRTENAQAANAKSHSLAFERRENSGH